MRIDKIRFRVNGEAVVLQVLEVSPRGIYECADKAEWRDAKVEDLLEVARYTRAYDALDKNIDSLTNTVSHLQENVSDVLEQNQRFLNASQQ